MRKSFPTIPIILIATGAAALFFSVRGIIVGSVPFVGRNDVIYSISSVENGTLFWFVEVFYFIAGAIFIIYGFREIKSA